MPNIWEPSSTFLPQAQAEGTLMSQRFIATTGQVLYTLTEFSYSIGAKSLMVFKAGLPQVVGIDYLETSETSITFFVAPAVNQKVVIYGFVGITGTLVTGDGSIKVQGSDGSQGFLATKLKATSPIVATIVDEGEGELVVMLTLDTANILENTETATISGNFQYTGVKTNPNNLATQADLAAAASGTPTATLNVYNHNTFNNFFA